MLNKIIRYFLENKLVTVLLLIALLVWGIATAPFGWKFGALPTDPIPVDAIPDIGENQQIVYSPWPGRSPQDIEDQVSYPLTTYLLGIPGVKTIRSTSVFGFSSIFIIFNEEADFYWSRSRIIEKLNSIPAGLLPEDVRPALGPDATALGQVYWYTLEGRDREGNPTGGWDLHEIRTVQDFYVKYALNSAEGVSEVASIGGFVQEYQVDVNPDALKAFNVPLHAVMNAVKQSNRDAGAKTIEINQAEYLVRGLGQVEGLEDIESAVVDVRDNVPVRIRDIATVTLGPASRRGILDKDGAEVVGGVVVARYGSNAMEVINNVKERIAEISGGLPAKTLDDGTESRLTIVPFYDRSELIRETLGTLEEALSLEVLITILVIIVTVFNLRASVLISSLLPIAVLFVFIAMRYTGVDANIVALSGIAIAIGTMVDLGIILSENVIRHIDEAPDGESLLETVYKGASEVGSAILTAVSTTIVSFIPVFAMQAAEGKLFRPLAFTKTYALIAALLVTLIILPALAHWFFGIRVRNEKISRGFHFGLIIVGMLILFTKSVWAGVILAAFGIAWFLKKYVKHSYWILDQSSFIIALIAVNGMLARYWLPLGPQRSLALNFIFVVMLVGVVLGTFALIQHYYPSILKWCLGNKRKFLLIPVFTILLGAMIWLGFDRIFGFVARGTDMLGWNIRTTGAWTTMVHAFPGTGEEFMPSLDEGSFLLMPSSMPHSGVEFNKRVLAQLDMLLANIPEVELAVGKLGRVESALDPAPISMFENVINYKAEYLTNNDGHRQRFRTNDEGEFILVSGQTTSNTEALANGVDRKDLIPDENGQYYRNWRDHIHSPDDIWNEIVRVTRIPGVTSAPKLQPIETRLVMLQTGMRAPMGIKVFGPDLITIEEFGLALENILKNVPSVKSEAVYAERIVGKPYMQLKIDRERIARFGLTIADVQQTIEAAIGGMQVTSTVEGRERFPVRVRYPRELRDDHESIEQILIPTPTGIQVPLGQLVSVEYERGPQAIKSEDTFLVGYVLFDKREGFSEVDVVENARAAIQQRIDAGDLKLPPGVSFQFSGSYENQVRAEARLSIIVPVVLVIVFLILYFQFRSAGTSLMVFSAIAMAFSGGFLMIWLYGQGWFADFSIFGMNFRDLFSMHTINLSVAVWVGFIALFGIATDDGVLIATYLDQSFRRNKPGTRKEVHEAVIEAGTRRVRPALMTVSTTMIALLPVLSSTGRGADIMIPMAIPVFGGMAFAVISIFIVPVLYSMREERRVQTDKNGDLL